MRVACRMEGDAFEMEDQRNWMDASYKTYVRPLALPWPYTIAQGEKLGAEGHARRSPARLPAPRPAGGDGRSRSRSATATVARMPAVGLAVPAEHAEAALELAELLRAPAPAFLVGRRSTRARATMPALVQAYGELARRARRRAGARGGPALRRRGRQADRRSRRSCGATCATCRARSSASASARRGSRSRRPAT